MTTIQVSWVSHPCLRQYASAAPLRREVLPPLGYDNEFVAQVCAFIDGHDTRAEARSLEDALVRDADRLWRFDHAGIALASGWFRMDPATYTDRLEAEIFPALGLSSWPRRCWPAARRC